MWERKVNYHKAWWKQKDSQNMMEQKAYYSKLNNLVTQDSRNVVKIVQSTRSAADEKCVQ